MSSIFPFLLLKKLQHRGIRSVGGSFFCPLGGSSTTRPDKISEFHNVHVLRSHFQLRTAVSLSHCAALEIDLPYGRLYRKIGVSF